MATRISPLAAQIELIGVDKVKTALREVSTGAEQMSSHLETHYGKAARHLALVTNEAVRVGEIGGSALQKILTVGGDRVGMFGAGGAIVGALSITGLAIYNIFDRARKQIEETAKAVRAELRSLEDASAATIGGRINRVVSGDPFADKKIERLSNAQLQAEKAKIGAGTTQTITATGQIVTAVSAEQQNRLKKINDELERRNTIVRQGIPLLQAAAVEEAKKTMMEGKAELQKKALTEEEKKFKKQLDKLATLGHAPASGSSMVDALGTAGALAESVSKRGAAAGAFDLTKVVGDPKELANKFAKEHPFDINAWFEAYVAAGNEGGLIPKINSPLQQMADQIRGSISHTLGSAIYDGFASAFSGKGLGGIFKSFGKTLLAGLGSIISEQGQVYLEYSGIMQAFTPLLGNPFTAGFAGAAIGAALIALGAALGAAAQGGGRSHASATVPRPAEITNIKLTATSVADQARYNPQGAVQMTVIGPGDPVAFRQIQQGLDNNARRGG